jgi:hypothetical protein
MRRWLALGLLGLALGCRETTTEWGRECNAYRIKVKDDCEKHGKKGGLWNQACPGYMDAVAKMEQSVPPEGTFKEKFDAAEPQCKVNRENFEQTTKDTKDFPR